MNSDDDVRQKTGSTHGMTYRHCQATDDCHEHGSLEDERDQRPLPRDPAERAKVPLELSEAILKAVEGWGEQTTLTAATAMADGGPAKRQNSEDTDGS